MYQPSTPRRTNPRTLEAKAPGAGWRGRLSHLSDAASALRHRPFRIFIAGQAVSLMGTWMQSVGQSWLVLKLTASPFLLGLVSAAQFAPILLFSLFAGVVADRFSRRGVVLVTQTMMMLAALTLAVLVHTGVVQYWHVLVLALVLGTANAFDTPARQALIVELVGREDMMNAIALNSTVFNVARLVGPAVAGVAIGAYGVATAFFANGFSFLAVIASLWRIRTPAPSEPVRVQRSLWLHIGEGLRYIRKSPEIARAMLLLGALSLFTMNFNVVVPVYAIEVLGQQAQGFGVMMSAMGVGALVGALGLAARSREGLRAGRQLRAMAAVGLGVFSLVLAAVRSLYGALPVLGLIGWSMVTFSASSNTVVQLSTPDSLRGRTMSFFNLMLTGVVPFGSLFTGTLADLFGVPVTLVAAGLIGLAATLWVRPWREVREASGAPKQPESP